MGSASVSIVEYNGVKAIQKKAASETEHYFYTRVLNQQSENQISAPCLLAFDENSLVIEYLPYLLSKDDWSSPQILKNLSKLHNKEFDVQKRFLFPLSWDSEQTESAISFLADENRVKAEKNIQPFFSLRETIFEPVCWISGDSNIGNWGRRESGEYVLFDWERFTRGSPVIDLAPLLPGLSDPKQVKQICERYLLINPNCSIPLADLVRQTLVAKAWIAVEVINILHQRSNSRTDEYMIFFNQVLADWLENTSKVL